MPFDPITDEESEVGKPIKKELIDKIKNDLDDHETRLQTAMEGSGKVVLINEDFLIGLNPPSNGVLYYEVIQDCIITEGAIQLFAKGLATAGSLTVDVKKNTSTNPSGFNSIFSIAPSLNMASSSDYQRQLGVINPSNQSLSVGNILRVDTTSIPASLSGFRLVLTGEF